VDGPDIVARSLSVPGVDDKYGNQWQYHSRSDRHSKIACWAVFFDLLQNSSLLQSHVRNDKVIFGVNHTMADFKNRRDKNLDLVIARPGTAEVTPLTRGKTLTTLADYYGVLLTPAEQKRLDALPEAVGGSVGSVLVALEAKAAMTAHQRARPRLYDELNSSHLTVHGASDHAAAAAFVMVNVSPQFLSSDMNKFPLSSHPPVVNEEPQPKSAQGIIDKIGEMPRRSRPGEEGFDAIGIVLVECRNDGSPITIHTGPPAPGPTDDFHYDQMVRRLGHIYDSRFATI
jgi:hypothetical protein